MRSQKRKAGALGRSGKELYPNAAIDSEDLVAKKESSSGVMALNFPPT